MAKKKSSTPIWIRVVAFILVVGVVMSSVIAIALNGANPNSQSVTISPEDITMETVEDSELPVDENGSSDIAASGDVVIEGGDDQAPTEPQALPEGETPSES